MKIKLLIEDFNDIIKPLTLFGMILLSPFILLLILSMVIAYIFENTKKALISLIIK